MTTINHQRRPRRKRDLADPALRMTRLMRPTPDELAVLEPLQEAARAAHGALRPLSDRWLDLDSLIRRDPDPDIREAATRALDRLGPALAAAEQAKHAAMVEHNRAARRLQRARPKECAECP